MSFIYIASPYTDPDPNVQEVRYLEVMKVVQGLLLQRKWCYSPIIHCHEIAKRFGHNGDFAYWMDYDFTMILASSELWVVRLPGWIESKGVNAEIIFATAHNKPVFYL